MAISDILAQSGDGQDFIVELPAGDAGNLPVDILSETDGTLLCAETPEIVDGGGGNIFIMSE
jgi:hypothetical protein